MFLEAGSLDLLSTCSISNLLHNVVIDGMTSYLSVNVENTVSNEVGQVIFRKCNVKIALLNFSHFPYATMMYMYKKSYVWDMLCFDF